MKIQSYGRRLKTVSALSLVLALAGAVTIAGAAPAAAQSADQQPPISTEQLSQAQLESFVAAANRVGEISGELQVQAQGVEDEAELARLQEAANQEMVAAVQEEGLTVDEYNMIFQMAQVDQELNATLREMMTE